MNIIKNKKKYFIFSGTLILIGFMFILLFGLRLSIDFTGGSRLNLEISNPSKEKIEQVLESRQMQSYTVTIDGRNVLIRTAPLEISEKNEIVEELRNTSPELSENSFETIGPTIGGETQVNALKAVIIASIAITAYVAFAFRKVSKPVASWKYGVIAIVTLLHDVFIVIGLFAVLGKLFNVELDALFITALLTVMGFSVHDTIVVFDRVRENLRRNLDLKFGQVVNNALLETLNRSLNTSITVAIVLVSLLLLGGDSIKWFTVALLAGVVVGTYSSIFIASPLLVVWNNWSKDRKNKIRIKLENPLKR